jgi:Sec-independent protein translocase protein TatA
MLFGMTPGEVALVAFIFGLVFAAAHVPRAGALLGRKIAAARARRPTGDG